MLSLHNRAYYIQSVINAALSYICISFRYAYMLCNKLSRLVPVAHNAKDPMCKLYVWKHTQNVLRRRSVLSVVHYYYDGSSQSLSSAVHSACYQAFILQTEPKTEIALYIPLFLRRMNGVDVDACRANKF